jgi:(2Fe-2S) ferredoxin
MAKYERHIFVCTNERPPENARGSCTGRGSHAVRDAFKAEVKRAGLAGRVRVNTAGCMDQCEHGPTVVVYPDAVWYGFVNANDVPEIVERHIARGEPVARLMLPDSCINNPGCPHRAKAPPA